MTAPEVRPEAGRSVRLAAVGDIHMGSESRGLLRPAFGSVPAVADVLLLAGDLTRHGTPEEARVVAAEVADLGVPVVAVLGNHDHHHGAAEEVSRVLAEEGGVTVLEGSGVTLPIGPLTLGIAGTKGFGGGFVGRCAGEFGESEMKAFVALSRDRAQALAGALTALGPVDVLVALTHYSPVEETLAGEPLEIYPFLGSYLLAEAIDGAETDLAVHGHAHARSERGSTSRGVHVRNVAQPVIRHAFAIYELHARRTAPTADQGVGRPPHP